MGRKLNSNIFQSPNIDQDPVSPSVVAVRNLEEELRRTKRNVGQLESLVEVLQSQVNVLAKEQEHRLVGVSQALHQMEKSIETQQRQMKLNQAQFAEHINEHKEKDLQVEVLIERFNESLSMFENQMHVLKKKVESGDLSLINFRKVLEAVVSQVDRLYDTAVRPDHSGKKNTY